MNVPGSKHLTLEDRMSIQDCINKGLKLCEMSDEIGKDPRTVSKEVKKRRNKVKNGKTCFNNKHDVKECPRLKRFPYVCNNCPNKRSCFKEYRYYYDARIAQENYEIILSDSRIGLDVTLEEKQHFDEILEEGVKNGQSIHHIVTTHKDDIRYSVRSAYRLVKNGQTTIQSLDLRRSVKLKPRSKHYVYKEDNKAIRVGRTYNDFLSFIASEPFPVITELDTVESVRNGVHKCLLTIHNTATHFMIIIVLERKTKANVSKAILELRETLGMELFKRFFRICLTDRGTEFCDPEAIEVDFETGERICNLFYCNSYSSYQKGAIENNHELIRYILPKRTLFDFLTQKQADLMASHINSYQRASMEETPINLARSLYGEELLEKTKIRDITPDSVILNPSLLIENK